MNYTSLRIDFVVLLSTNPIQSDLSFLSMPIALTVISRIPAVLFYLSPAFSSLQDNTLLKSFSTKYQ
ncbi:MAG: hypothetical protein ACTS73_04750 [Arsenophonus sp. NEOnobi-MAG3]